MVHKSLFPVLDIPQTNLLTYLFDDGRETSTESIWIDAKEPERRLTLEQGLQWIKRLGLGLQRLGLQKGDPVLIFTPNHLFVPIAYLGIIGSGCVFSGANPLFTAAELSYQLSNIGAKAVLAHPDGLNTVLEAAAKAGLPKNRIFTFSDTFNATVDGVVDWRTILASPREADSWRWPEFGPGEASKTIATINYSSGTTGFPKGVCVSHASLIANTLQAILGQREKEARMTARGESILPERWIGFLPLYHAFGQLYCNLMAPKLRVRTYIMKKFIFEDFLAVIQNYKITTLQVAPPIVIMLNKRPETRKYDLSSVTAIGCGAAPLSREMQLACEELLKIEVVQGYGMTELTCSAITMQIGMDNPVPGCVGRLNANCEAKLIDEDGKEVGYDTPGELYIRGPNVCMGYWKNEAATAESLDSEGWFKTGDIATVNAKGYYWIVDRKKELIKVNGLQVAPAELEATLLENEHVADAAVVQVILYGNEWPRAYVVIQPGSRGQVTPTSIQEWVAARVAKHKKLVGGVVFIDEVPKLASGKIMRKVMKEWAKKDAAAIEKNGPDATTLKAKL